MNTWIIDQLIQQGVTHFCIAPGSRSSPLVSAVAEHPQAKLHIHFDERGLGFLALGIAKASKVPATLIVTSGTAVGNLLPSVMEAHHASIPLILLTADRPPELRDCGANQTTDQMKLFQSFVRWQVDLPPSLDEKYFRSIAAQGFCHAVQNPPGPVQLNCPFREPLYQPEIKWTLGKPLSISLPRLKAAPFRTEKTKGLILIGALSKPSEIQDILKLAKRLQWPVCADILSNARSFPTAEQIRFYDWMDKPTPEIVLHFGERMTSKRILQWLKKIEPEYIHISPIPFLQDPERIVTGRVQADIAEFCHELEAKSDPNWLKAWEDKEPLFQERGTFTEVHAMRKLSSWIPAHYGVFLGNGMPIRDADHFLFPEECRAFFANRGLSGIDGNIATIAGLAEEMPMIGIIGDQAALYDLNSLPLLKKTKYPALLLISNNFGGGIFHHLPIHASPHFETLWAAAHDLEFEKAADWFNIPHFRFSAFEEALLRETSAIIELTTNRVENHQYQTTLV
jgi:2-succinyl-5-enolpyruvyl-6-hydroxy-3-cyclohexene-1-carboxylate synthase